MKRAGTIIGITTAIMILAGCGNSTDQNVNADANVNASADINASASTSADVNDKVETTAAPGKNTEKTVLTLGTVSVSEGLYKQVSAFNQQNTEYEIEIKSYAGDMADGGNAVNTIQMEIAAGKGPDIVDFGYLYTPGAVSKGITEDLSVYMEADEDFNKEDYFMNIIEAFAVDGKIYAVAPQFSIKSVVGRKSDLGDAGSWNMQEMIDFYQEKGQGKALFMGQSKIEVFGTICMGCLDSFINWEDGTCSFDDGRFRELISFTDQFPLQADYSNMDSVLPKLQSGNILLNPAVISNVYTCAEGRIIFGDNPVTYIGYPVEEGSGNIVSPGSMVLGINKNSQNKDAAWEFIKSFLQEEYQGKIENELPVLKSELDRRLEEARVVEYEEDETGNKKEKVKDTILFEGADPIDIFCITDQDAEALLTVINSAETAYVVDYELYSIILEEISLYFEENRDLDSVIEVIQGRASIYVSEHYS